MTISFIIPSINRPSLQRTIESINPWLGDEIIVEFDIPRSFRWGNDQRNKGMKRATCEYLAFIDDDDFYVPDARFIIDEELRKNPGKPILFQLQYPNGDKLWKTKEVIPGNIATAMILVPNTPEMLHYWEDGRNMADFIFVNKWKWPKEEIVWIDKVISLTGHDDGKAIHHE